MITDKRHFSVLILTLATIFWGSTFAFTRELVKVITPLELISSRLLITAIMIFFIFPRKIVGEYKTLVKDKKVYIKHIFFFGLVNFLAIFCQAYGLKYILVTNSGFITSLSVLFVPVIDSILRKNRVKRNMKYAIVLALIGLYIMSFGFTLNMVFSKGDLITLLCALFYAILFIEIDILAKKFSSSFVMFNMFLITSLIAFSFYLPEINVEMIYYSIVSSNNVINYILLIILGTIIPYLLMGVGQRYLDAQTASLIYIFEPLFASSVAFLFFDELVGLFVVAGGFILLLAQIVGLDLVTVFKSKFFF